MHHVDGPVDLPAPAPPHVPRDDCGHEGKLVGRRAPLGVKPDAYHAVELAEGVRFGLDVHGGFV